MSFTDFWMYTHPMETSFFRYQFVSGFVTGYRRRFFIFNSSIEAIEENFVKYDISVQYIVVSVQVRACVCMYVYVCIFVCVCVCVWKEYIGY